MTVTVRELDGSRPVEFTGGRGTATRSFWVEQDSPALSSPDDVIALMGSNNLPKKGDSWPGNVLLEARDYKVRRAEGQTDCYLVDFGYGDAAGTLSFPDKQPGETGYVEITADVRGQFEDMWRSVSAAHLAELVAAGGLYPYGSAATTFDIGGQHVDAAGEPTSVLRRIVEINVSVTVDAKPQIGTYYSFYGRRNNTIFAGAPQGTVVYAGAGARKLVDERKWSVDHRFVVDQYYHMLQVPYRTPDGRVWLDDADGTARNVWYVQPFPDFGNFYAIDANFAGQL